MNAAPESNWQPDPQLLAAYFDGELEGRNELADMRARIEAWLEAHPEAAKEWTQHRELQKLWLDTTPAEPSEAAWQDALARIETRRHAPGAVPARGWPWLALGAGFCAASVLVMIGVGVLRLLPPNGPPVPVVVAPKVPPAAPNKDEVEVFEVALASEISILRVEGADTGSLVVGVPPVVGPLELADPGEVRVVNVRPDARHNMAPNRQQDGPRRPMFWAARLETE